MSDPSAFTATKTLPQLPPEIWSNIFWQHTDPFQLWTDGRQVSRFWQNEIPKVFASKYLQRPMMTEVKFDCGAERCISMRFARFDPSNRSRCIFVENECSKRKRGPPEEIDSYNLLKYAAWKKRLDAYLASDDWPREESGRQLPAHTIRVKTTANDTELPGLRYDFENKEISFEWSGMFDMLFREELNFKHRIVRYLDGREQPPQVDPKTDPNGFMEALMKLSAEMEKQMKETSRVVRRRRIQRFYMEHAKVDILERKPTFWRSRRLEEDEYLRRISEAKDDGCYIKFAEDRDLRRGQRREGKREDRNTDEVKGDVDVYEDDYTPYYGFEERDVEEPGTETTIMDNLDPAWANNHIWDSVTDDDEHDFLY